MKRFVLFLMLTALPAIAPAQQLTDTLTVDPNVTIGKLPNGLTYFIRVNKKPEARAELRLAVNAGSVLEDESQRGLAHAVEHMAFNGTQHFKKQELVHYLESIGMRFGADLNAYTSFDETVYMLTVPTDTARFLEQGMQILEDWAHGVTFDPAEIDKERGVVIEEWRLGQGAEQRMRSKYFPVLFAGSRYAARLPIGTEHSLRTFKHEDLIRFYRRWYRPELMAVIAVGDFDSNRVEQLIRSHFSGITSRDTTPRVLYPVPDHDSTLVSIVSDKEASIASVSVYHKLPVHEERTIADYRQMLARSLFAEMLNQRLSELAQQSSPPFIGASGSNGSLVRAIDAFVLSAATKDTAILSGLEAILTEAARVQRHGFTGTELERAKQNLLRGYERAHEEREKTESAAYADEYVAAFLEHEPIPGIIAEYDLAKALLPRIPVEMVNALVKEWVGNRNRVIVVRAPQKPGVKLPTQMEILETFARVEARNIQPYDDRRSDASLVATLPLPGTIVAQKHDTATDIIEWKLSNGVRILLKPTDFKKDEILVRGYSPGGTSLVSDQDFVSASMAPFVIGSSGVGSFSNVDLGKLLAGKAVRVASFINEKQEGFNAQASSKDAETLFQLIYMYATAPRRDTTAFQSLRARLTALLENRSARPEAAFGDTLAVTLAQHHLRARPLTMEILRELDLDRAMATYIDRFKDASDFTYVIVGSFQPDSIKPLVLRYLGGLPSIDRRERWRDSGLRPPVGVIEKVVRKGIEPKAATQIVFTGPFDDAQDRRVAVSLMTRILEIRLREVLREDLGATYGVNVGFSSAPRPKARYTINISFGADPARLDSLAVRVFAEIHKLQRQGVTDQEVATAKETARRAWETNIKQNSYWIGQIAGRDFEGEAFTSILSYPQRLQNTSAAQINAAAALMRANNYVRVSLVPEK